MAGALPPSRSVQLDRNRAALLEHLYQRDGRGNPAHPHAFTYTGLAAATRAQLGAAALELWTEAWHDDSAPPVPLPLPVVDAPAGVEA